MNKESVVNLTKKYDDYLNTFRNPEGVLSSMMQLKRTHTAFVIANAKLIAEGEGFDEETTLLCEAAALLHDTGRYEQLKRYNTFRDSESVDHAVFSHDIVVEKGWLDNGEFSPAQRDAILKAVLVHNRKDIPVEEMNDCELVVARTTRDSDKLDIFRVLEDQVNNTDWRADSRAFWNLSISASPSPAVIEAIKTGCAVKYQDIQSLADFVLIQVGWMISGLEFATSRRLVKERGHLEFRRKFLHELTDDPVIDEVCNIAQQ